MLCVTLMWIACPPEKEEFGFTVASPGREQVTVTQKRTNYKDLEL